MELPPHLAAVHDVFHVSQLKQCVSVPKQLVDTSNIHIELDLTFEERPVRVLDQKQRVTRKKTITFYKVKWSNHSEDEATWEQEEYLQTKYPEFLAAIQNKYVYKKLTFEKLYEYICEMHYSIYIYHPSTYNT